MRQSIGVMMVTLSLASVGCAAGGGGAPSATPVAALPSGKGARRALVLVNEGAAEAGPTPAADDAPTTQRIVERVLGGSPR